MKFKNLLLSVFFLICAVCFLSIETFSQQQPQLSPPQPTVAVKRRTTFRGETYAYKMTDQDFANTPSWNQENEPPISVAGAVRIARENLSRFVKSGETWKMRAVMLQGMGEEKWYYRIHFSCATAAVCRETEDRMFTMIVKMDGNIVEPKKVTTEP